MEKSKLKEQVEVIRQAFGYINKFKNETFVIKIESSLIPNPLFPILIKDLVLLHSMGIRIVIVPGARTRIDEILSTYNIKCDSINGIRISTHESIPFIKMAAFDVSNKIMTLLAESDAHGVIGNWVKARSIGVRNGVDYQSSGIVEKLHINVLKNVLEDGMIPIFPNIGWSAKGKPYNLSSNELAFTISTELKAAKLFFITDQASITSNSFIIPSGVYVSSDGTVSQLNVEQAGVFIEKNKKAEHNEMLELISLAYRACTDGVRRVHIVDGQAEGMILKEIFSNRGLGTMIYANQHENIRPMVITDIPEVLALMQPAIEQQILISRTSQDLEEKIDDYAVYEVDGTIHACGALHLFSDKQAEIAAITVDEMYSKLGIGRKMISYLMEKAISIHLKAVFVLTTQTSDWFSQLGFTEATIADLPPEKQQLYNYKRNPLILRYKLPKNRNKNLVPM
jgi:amino-acid N-acetyltransferase